MELVLQRGAFDCGVAALAMVAGVPYEVAESETAPHLRGGLTEQAVWGALSRMGFAVQVFCSTPAEPLVNYFAPCPFGWPPRPFAPAHIATIILPQGAHFIAVNEAGAIFDPRGVQPPEILRWVSFTGVWRTVCNRSYKRRAQIAISQLEALR
jgi:hypothetical protein